MPFHNGEIMAKRSLKRLAPFKRYQKVK